MDEKLQELITILAETGAAILQYFSQPAVVFQFLIIAGLLTLIIAAVLLLRGRGPAAAGARTSTTRVAVLPFVTQGSGGDFVGAGMSDEVRGRLTRVGGLAVVSSATASQYAESGKRPQDIAREIGADYLLLGRVRETGEGAERRIQVVPELIEGKTGQVRFQFTPHSHHATQTISKM